MEWRYEKVNDEQKVQSCPMNDLDGKITGKCILNLKAWFDENPEERIRLGWTKHITHRPDELNYDPQTQIVLRGLKQVDEYTVEDVLTAVDKSEDLMALEELTGSNYSGSYSIGLSIISG